MTAEEYLRDILAKQDLTESEMETLRNYRERIQAVLSQLPGSPRFYYAGSYGKRTIIREKYDLDIVIYWPQGFSYTIKELYDSVGKKLKTVWTTVNSKTVAWEIPIQRNFHIDVVPGRALDAQFFEANLYRTDTGTTLKTSIKTHIDIVRSSNRRDAIRLLKLWRERKQVPFKKSFLLEMMTIEGTKGINTLPEQVMAALAYIKNNIETAQIKDPANSNNVLSDDIQAVQKQIIKNLATTALGSRTWDDIFRPANEIRTWN